MAHVVDETFMKCNFHKIDLSYKALPGSRKIYKRGKIFKDIFVPFRQVIHQETKKLEIYDTSGPYTDPVTLVF